MYKGFNLKLKGNQENDQLSQLLEAYNYYNALEKGTEIFNENKKKIHKNLEDYLRDDNKLDGSSIKNNWFPQIKADIFISHSHKDEEKAIALSGWLKETFELNAFIDSLVWDYAPNLIDELNNKYNIISREPNITYNYQTGKYISSHVDLMLSTALNSMIDHCEALFFLNTPSSTGKIVKDEKIKSVDIESPWIYSELETSRIVREKIERRRIKTFVKAFESGGSISRDILYESKLPPIVYDTDIKHLYKLTKENLEEWRRLYKAREESIHFDKTHPLDTLYDLMKI